MSRTTHRWVHIGLAVFFLLQMPLVPFVFDEWFERYIVWVSQWALVASHWTAAEAIKGPEGK